MSKSISTPSEEAVAIYEAYPRKVGRPIALRAIQRALKTISFEHLYERTCFYAEMRKCEDPAFTPHPATWFNQARYNDDPSTWVTRPNPMTTKPKPTFLLS